MSSKIFERRSELPVDAVEAVSGPERPGTLDRLIPPWESVKIADRGEGVRDGSVVKLIAKMGPLKLAWTAEDHDDEAGRCFRNARSSGPFAKWEHQHKFESVARGRCILEDRIEYRLPGGRLGTLLGGNFVRKKTRSQVRLSTQHDPCRS